MIQLLQQLHDKLTRKLSPAKAVDPLTVLPVELAEMILEYLSFKNLINCMRVSRGWRDYLQKLPRLWLHLDMSAARRPVPSSFVDKAVRRSQYRLERLTVHRFDRLDVVKNVAKACKNLRDVRILSLPMQTAESLIELVKLSPNLQKFVISPEITLGTCAEILRYGPKLRHAQFLVTKSAHRPDWTGPLPCLEYLSIAYPGRGQVEGADINTLLALTPSLSYLDVAKIVVEQPEIEHLPLKTLILSKTDSSTASIYPASLRDLTVESPDDSAWEMETSIRRNSLPNLTRLDLNNVRFLCAPFFTKLLDRPDPERAEANPSPQNHRPVNATPLQHLAVRGTLDDNVTGLFRTPGNVLSTSPRILTPALTSLALYDLPVNDDEIEALLTHKTSLKSIDLSGSRVTGASIKMLVDGLSTLKSIRLDNCDFIVGRDAIEYAERRGVTVHYRGMDREVGKGRKVRQG